MALKVWHEEGHKGAEEMKNILALKGWRVSLEKLRKIVVECENCAKMMKISGLEEKYERTIGEIWSRVQMDIKGPLPESVEGWRYFLLFKDMHTKFVMTEVLRSRARAEIKKVLWSVVGKFGVPKILQADNAPELVAVGLEVADQVGFKFQTSPAYHQASNGGAERGIGQVMHQLAILGQEGKRAVTGKWSNFLQLATLQVNEKLEEDFCTPALVFLGRDKWSELRKEKGIDEKALIADYGRKVLEAREKADEGGKFAKGLQVGAKVMMRVGMVKSKFHVRNEGPFWVHSGGAGRYNLRDENGAVIKENVARKFLIIVNE